MHVSSHAEISWVDDLVGRWVVENGLGVNSGLVGKRTETCDVVVLSGISMFSNSNFYLTAKELAYWK